MVFLHLYYSKREKISIRGNPDFLNKLVVVISKMKPLPVSSPAGVREKN